MESLAQRKKSNMLELAILLIIFVSTSWPILFFYNRYSRKPWRHFLVYHLISTGLALFLFYFLHYELATRLSEGGAWRFPLSAQYILLFSKFVLGCWVVAMVFQSKRGIADRSLRLASLLNFILAISINWSVYEHIFRK